MIPNLLSIRPTLSTKYEFEKQESILCISSIHIIIEFYNKKLHKKLYRLNHQVLISKK